MSIIADRPVQSRDQLTCRPVCQIAVLNQILPKIGNLICPLILVGSVKSRCKTRLKLIRPIIPFFVKAMRSIYAGSYHAGKDSRLNGRLWRRGASIYVTISLFPFLPFAFHHGVMSSPTRVHVASASLSRRIEILDMACSSSSVLSYPLFSFRNTCKARCLIEIKLRRVLYQLPSKARLQALCINQPHLLLCVYINSLPIAKDELFLVPSIYNYVCQWLYY